jgi:hypothetical protein
VNLSLQCLLRLSTFTTLWTDIQMTIHALPFRIGERLVDVSTQVFIRQVVHF